MDSIYSCCLLPSVLLGRLQSDPILGRRFKNMGDRCYASMMQDVLRALMTNNIQTHDIERLCTFHASFDIDDRECDAWVTCFKDAMRDVGFDSDNTHGLMSGVTRVVDSLRPMSLARRRLLSHAVDKRRMSHDIDTIIDTYKSGGDITEALDTLQETIHVMEDR